MPIAIKTQRRRI